MTPRRQQALSVQAAVMAATSADAWIGAKKRSLALVGEFGAKRVDQTLQARVLEKERIRRSLPSFVPQLLPAFLNQKHLGDWLKSPQALIFQCRLAGAVAFGGDLARVVDRASIARFVNYLGTETWQYAVANPANVDVTALAPNDLSVRMFDMGLNIVRSHLEAELPEISEHIAAATGLDWSTQASRIDANREVAALRCALQYARV